MQEDLSGLLAARFGHFQLESGHHGDRWLDLDRLFLRPAAVRPLAVELAGRLAAYDVAGVCGPLTGGALLAEMIAAELEVELYYTERFAPARPAGLYAVEYRLPSSLRQAVRGKRVAVVDDAVNAGSALRATLAELRTCGAQPVAAGALLLLGAAAEFFAEQGLPVESLAGLASHVWAPDGCPLCAAGIPLEDPGG